MTKPNIAEDRRIDPRIKTILGAFPDIEMQNVESREELLAALDRIQRRLGGSRHRELRELLVQALQQQTDHGDSKGHRRWIEPLLRDYYDPMYDYMLQQRHGPILFQGSRHDAEIWLKQTQQA